MARLSNETKLHTLYAKETLQAEGITLTTATGEVLELSYSCWVYYVSYTEETKYKYLIVKENSGSLLEINTKNDEKPADLAEWREVKGEEPETPCQFDDPKTDLLWLKEMIAQFEEDAETNGYNPHARIYQCHYKEGIGFLLEMCVGCPDAGYSFRDCEGEILCEDDDACLEFEIDFEKKELIWEKKEIIKPQYLEFAPIGAEWYYTSTSGRFPNHFNHIISEKDTIVKGYNCRILNQYYDDSYITETYIIKQEQGRVYYYHQDQFHLLYDFEAKVNDIITFSLMGIAPVMFPEFRFIDTIFSVRAVVENITINAQNLKMFTIKILEEDRFYPYFPVSYTYTEKIGFDRKFLFKLQPLGSSGILEYIPYFSLRCYSDAELSFVSDEWMAKALPCDAIVYQPVEFAPIGTEWYYSDSPYSPDGNFNYVVSEKDTIVAGSTCRVLSQYQDNSTVASKRYIIKQKEQRKIYYYYQDQFHLLFDFEARVNDTVRFTFMYKKYSDAFPEGKDTLFSARFRVEKITSNGIMETFTTKILEEDILHFQGFSVPDFSEYSYAQSIGLRNLLGSPIYREFIPMLDNIPHPEIEYFRGLRCFSGPVWDTWDGSDSWGWTNGNPAACRICINCK